MWDYSRNKECKTSHNIWTSSLKYRIIAKYDIMKAGGKDILILRRQNINESIVNILSIEEYYENTQSMNMDVIRCFTL